MRTPLMSLILSVALIGGLAACVPDPTLVEAGLAKPPEAKVATGVYASTMDGAIPIPAVPVEKVPTEFQRQTVYYPTNEAPGTIVINPAGKHLYLVTGNNTAIRYGIAVGAAGFQWSGEALITDRKTWPTWTPPKEMIERKPELAKWEKGQPGGPTNPLGARALYLTTNGVDYGYRIHGTPEWSSIGRNASSGCIRMINQDVMDLYARVPDGSKVIVLTADGKVPNGLTLPPPPPKKIAAASVPRKPAPVQSTPVLSAPVQSVAAPSALSAPASPAITSAPIDPAAANQNPTPSPSAPATFTAPPLPERLPTPPAVASTL